MGDRVRLQIEERTRDLAMYNLAIDSNLRGCDLINPRVDDICVVGRVRDRATIVRKKTGRKDEDRMLAVGGDLGGVSAALTAARLGEKVVLTEELDWLGGQLTSQGVPLDEHPWIETFSASVSYAEFRRRLRDYYRAHYDLGAEARRDGRVNPGMGNVGTLCCEPRVAVHVIDDMLAPFESAGQIRVLRRPGRSGESSGWR